MRQPPIRRNRGLARGLWPARPRQAIRRAAQTTARPARRAQCRRQASPYKGTRMLSAVDWYRLLRGQIEHEDALLSQRLNWFIMSQSFLFTAYAILPTSQAGPVAEGSLALAVLIPTVALCTSVLIDLSILAGILTIR